MPDKYVLIEENNLISKADASDVVDADTIISATSDLTFQQQTDILENLNAVRADQGMLWSPTIIDGSSNYGGVILGFNYDEQDEPFLTFQGNDHGETVLLTNISNPKNSSDVATKEYADNRVFIVNISYNYPNSYSADKTFNQILEAYNSGAVVLARAGGDFIETGILTKCSKYVGAEFCFLPYVDEFDVAMFIYYTVTKNNVWSRHDKEIIQDRRVNDDYSSTSIVLALAEYGNVYEYGTLTSLTVTDIDSGRQIFDRCFKIRFTSGSTPTVVSFPNKMKFPQPFVPAANTRYELQSSEGYTTVNSWPIT